MRRDSEILMIYASDYWQDTPKVKDIFREK